MPWRKRAQGEWWGEVRRALKLAAVHRRVLALELGVEAVDKRGALRLAPVASCRQCVGVRVADGGAAANVVVHRRLRERRVVELVVSVPPVAEQIEPHVRAKVRAKAHCELGGARHRHRVFAVDAQHWRAVDFRHVARVARRPRFFAQRGEAQLVVHDDVHRAARRVARQPREQHRLGHNTLTYWYKYKIEE